MEAGEAVHRKRSPRICAIKESDGGNWHYAFVLPEREIVRYAHEMDPDLVIMGAHGHGGFKDLIFGNTINPVRHDLDVPMLIVRAGKT